MSEQTDTSSTSATPPATLYAVSLLLNAPEGHIATAAIAHNTDEALAVALRSADRDQAIDALGGLATPIPSDVVATALIRWLLIADSKAIQTLAEDLLNVLPVDSIRDAWSVLSEAVEALDIKRQSRRRSSRDDTAAPTSLRRAAAA
jgi:hypothetical protein